MSRVHPQHKRDQVESLIWEGKSIREVAAITGVSRSTVSEWSLGRGRNPGQKPRKTMTPEKVKLLLVCLNRHGMPLAEAASTVGVSRELARRYVRYAARWEPAADYLRELENDDTRAVQ